MTRAADYTEQAMVSDWPARLFWVGVLLAAIALTLWLVRWGWKRRARRFAGLPALDRTVPAEAALVRGRYLGSAVAGDWLDRITAEGLGSPSECEVVVTDDALTFLRPSGLTFRIPTESIVEVRTDKGLLQEVYGADGVVVLTWTWGDVRVDSGFRADPVTDHAVLLARLSQYRVHQGGRS